MEYCEDKVLINTEISTEISTDLKIYCTDNFIVKKKKLIDICKNLTKLEYVEIFTIIKEDNCQYSENKNGIFINLTNINEYTIDKIFNFLNFIKHKKEDLIKHEEIINNVKKNINETNKGNDIIVNNEIEKNEYIYENEVEVETNYLIFSSDEDEDIENKISLKKKKTKYSGKKAKMIKSIKDNNNDNKYKNKSKKNGE
jgi:hypothetical protein